MNSQGYLIVALVLAFAVIIPLAFYAGKLLFQLKQQTKRQNAVRQQRINTMVESIQTISMAMEQQQCNLSEGAIRLVNLIESLPVVPAHDCQQHYPALYELYLEVRHLPTHEARAALPKQERQVQDQQREEHESRLESRILKEVTLLRAFSV